MWPRMFGNLFQGIAELKLSLDDPFICSVVMSEYAIELAHAEGQVCVGSFYGKVIMIVYQTVGMTYPALSIHRFAWNLKES